MCACCSRSQAATRPASTAAACVPGDLAPPQSGCCAQVYTWCRPAAGPHLHELSADTTGNAYVPHVQLVFGVLNFINWKQHHRCHILQMHLMVLES